MIKAIGINKFFLLLLLAVFIALAVFYNYQIITPDVTKLNRQVMTNKSEVSQMTQDLNSLTAGLEKFAQQKDAFEKVRRLGFFDPQNRVVAKQLITNIQRDSRLMTAKYTIKPAENLDDEKAREAGYKILSTDIDFILEALDDADVYKFVYLINYGFPGQVIINKLNIERDMEITQPLLRRIGVGQAQPIIKATFEVTWKTMVADETISVTETENGGAQ